MNSNKIIDNRPELTKEQILQGMDFKKIKNSAAIAKTAVLKSLIMKGLLGIIVISTGVFIYQNTANPTPAIEQIVLTKTEPLNLISNKDSVVTPKNTLNKNAPIIIVEPEIQHTNLASHPVLSIDTAIIHPVVNTNSEITPDKNSIIKDKLVNDTAVEIKGNKEQDFKFKNKSKLNQFTKCKLWNPNNFCDIPRKARLSSSYDENDVECDKVSCEEATKNRAALKAVWITIDAKGETRLQLESQLENITLVGLKNGKAIHPSMILAVSDRSNFFGKKFKAKKFVAKYSGKLDIFLFFSNAEIGDTILINNFVETVITE